MQWAGAGTDRGECLERLSWILTNLVKNGHKKRAERHMAPGSCR
jgi:hypothetical protein